MVNWTADKTAACVLLRKQRDTYAFSIFFSVKYQFYIHFRNKYQIGSSSTRPLIRLRPWTPLGDFRPQDTFPFASIHPQSYRAVDATAYTTWHSVTYIARKGMQFCPSKTTKAQCRAS